MKLADIAWQRLANQHLLGAKLDKPADVVARLGAVQAQDYAGGKWAVAQRMRDSDDAMVEQAVIDGSIIRTHILRPTWHFVTPADIRWMLALTGPRVKAAMGFQTRWLEIDSTALRRSSRVLTRALQGGKALVRTELAQVLAKAGLPVVGEQRLGNFLMHAEIEGIVCSGARRGKQLTYALLEERVPATPTMERDEALLRLANIYFATRGPATSADFVWWSGLTVADAKRGVELVASGLEHAIVDGRTYWFSQSAQRERSASPIVHLLPNWDEYSVAYKDRSALAIRLKKARVEVRNDRSLANIIVVDGQLVGTWKRTFKKNGVVLEASLLTSITRAERKGVIAAADAYGEFLDVPVESAILS